MSSVFVGREPELAALSYERPPLIVLDDMHWATPESVELFARLAVRVERAPFLVIMRGTTLDLEHPLVLRLAEIHRRRPCEYLGLGRLPRRAGTDPLDGIVGRPLPGHVVDRMYRESSGNPFFLGELGRYLRGHAIAADELVESRLPESIRAAVGNRISRLSTETRHTLFLASVFTAPFRFTELQALVGVAEEPLLDSLEQALAEELLRPLSSERYEFSHALVRRTLYRSSSPSRRARLHRRLAETLERLHAEDHGPVAAELVQQYHASATLRGAERGAVHALTAARVARRSSAPSTAVTALRLGLELARADDPTLRAELLGELARSEVDAGLFAEAATTLEAAVTTLERLEAPGERIAEVVFDVGNMFWFAPGISPAIRPLADRALRARLPDRIGESRTARDSVRRRRGDRQRQRPALVNRLHQTNSLGTQAA